MVEQRFQKLRKELKPIQFNNVKFLTAKADELKDSDPELAARILLRVKRLDKKKQNVSPKKVASTSSNNTDVKEKTTTSSVVTKNEAKKNSSEQQKKTSTKNTLLNRVLSYIDKKKIKVLLLKPFILFVVLPTLIFAFYQEFWATERFESQSQVIVQQPDASATMDAGMALLSGLGANPTDSDTELVKAYIYSNDMLHYLNQELDLRQHYSQDHIDFFSRIHDSDSKDALFSYYEDHVSVDLDEKSGVISIYVQAFDSEFAQKLNNKIVQRAEWFINSIGHQLADAQLDFMKVEYQNVEQKFAEAQTNLLQFQQRYNLLDPEAEGTAMQQIAYTLEGQIATKQAELKKLSLIMSNSSPQIKSLKNDLQALQAQLKNERNKLAESNPDELSVSEILARFTEYKVNMELALQAYTSSQVSWEKARIEAYRQLKYLIVVEASTLSEDSKYPEVLYNISLFVLLLSLAFGIVKIVITTIRELK